MSADNYMFIRKHGGKFAVTMEFASDVGPGPVDGRARVFETLEEAESYAHSEDTEYGVREEWGDDCPPHKEPIDIEAIIGAMGGAESVIDAVWRERSISNLHASNIRAFLKLRGWHQIRDGRWRSPYNRSELVAPAAFRQERELARRRVEQSLACAGKPVETNTSRPLRAELLLTLADCKIRPRGAN